MPTDNVEKITISFVKHEKFNPRKDYKHPTWFALSNSILEDPDYIDFSPIEFKALIYLFCQASKKKWAPVDIVFRHAKKFYDIDQKTLMSVIENLVRNQSVQISERDPNVIRTDTERDPNATDKKTDRQEDNTDRQTDAAAMDPENLNSPKDLAVLWNERVQGVRVFAPNKNKLPSVTIDSFRSNQERYKAASARICEQPTRKYWESVIARILASEGCRGRNDRHWLADFDFLVRPETHIKALEGKYDLWGKEVAAASRPGPAVAPPIKNPDAESTARMLEEQEANRRDQQTMTPGQIKALIAKTMHKMPEGA